MSRVGVVDLSAPPDDERGPEFLSPALLARALATGLDVTEVASSQLAAAEVDRLIAVVPRWCRSRSRLLDGVTVPIEVVDPWERSTAQPGYRAIARACHGDVDLAPHRSPVHPWVMASAPTSADSDETLRAALAGLSGLNTTRLVLGNERIAWTMERVRLLATLLTAALRERKSLVELDVRVWPEQLREPALLENLALLPLARLEVLLGSLHASTLEARGAASVDQLEEVVEEIARVGLAHLTTLNLALALPHETIQQTISALDRALRLAVKLGIPAVRCALWTGEGAPIDRDDQRGRFLETHPTWTEEEYVGIHDLLGVIRKVATDLTIVGPGFLPTWDRA